MKTKVKFLVHKDREGEDDLFALFPDQYEGNDFNVSYAHVGQHSACHIKYANESRYATEEEYNSLKEELESIGYELEIINP